MPLPHEDLITTLLEQLTPEERDHSVVYRASEPIRTGTRLEFPRISIDVQWDALLAFVDRDPMANWSHSCRYILLNIETGELQSFEAQLPPFRPDQAGRWSVAYKAPSVPDAVLAVPR